MRSSAMARAVRNTLMDTGTLSPSIVSMHTTNAMSVAVGIPQPLAAAVPLLMRAYMHAGAMTPPNAAITGSIAFLGEDSSPWAISRLISSPTVKKNTTIRMSLISFSTVMSFGKWMSVPFPERKRIWTLASSRLW